MLRRFFALTFAASLAATLQISTSAQSGAAASSSPRTPWGDPDLQCNYTKPWEARTPY
jgi:hypothetical protein